MIRAAGITRVHAFPYSPRPGTATAAADTVPVDGEEGAERAASRAVRRALPASMGVEGRLDGSRPRRPARAGGTATTTRRGSSTARSANSCVRAPSESPRRESLPSPPDNCLFCRLVAEGDHVHAADGFVAIRDINPIAETHILVLPDGTSTRSATSTRSRTRRPADAALRRRHGDGRRARRLQGARQRRRGRRARPSSISTGTSSVGDSTRGKLARALELETA